MSYVARRILYTIPLLIAVSLLSFVLVQHVPGDYYTRAQMNPLMSPETLERMRNQLGLDRPILVQYGCWLRNVITKGDFGISFYTLLPVYDTLFMGGRLFWTLIVSGSTMLLMWLVAIPLGIYAATHQYKPSDHIMTFFGFLGLSIPNFLFALFLLWLLTSVFSVGKLGLGVGGLFDHRFIGQPWSWAKFANLVWHLWPAWLVVGASGMPGLMRYMRGSLLDVLGLPYVRTARAKGLSERAVVYKHAVRNAINPLVSMLGMSLPGLVTGTLVTSVVLNLPTVEYAFWTAILRQDQYVIMGGLFFFSVFLLIGNLLADVLLTWVDPRIRYD